MARALHGGSKKGVVLEPHRLWGGGRHGQVLGALMVVLVPFGDVDRDALHVAATAVGSAFGEETRLGAAVWPVAEAWDRSQDQFRADVLLRQLGRIEEPGADKLLAVLDADATRSGQDFVFGHSVLSSREAVLALARLREPFHGRPADVPRFHERVAKEAVRVLGRTYGLDHCSRDTCVMFGSQRLEETDRKGLQFCEDCAGRLSA